MKKQKIIFRADGNSTIGMGHFMRTLALAEMLKDDFYCIYATQLPNEYQIKEITDICHERIDLPNDESHFDFFINLLRGDEIVVLDNYYFATQYQQKIKNKGCKLVCIDDIYDKEFVSDLIINHTPGVVPSNYKAQPNTQYALGLDYVLLRSKFLDLANKKRVIDKVETLLICFGGSDPNNLTLNAIQAAFTFKQFKKIIVIIGAGYIVKQSFETLVDGDERIEIRKMLSTKEMVESYLAADLAIVPSSGVLIEAICAKCIIITGIAAENQKFIYSHYIRNNYAYDASDFSSTKIKYAISKVLEEKQQTSLVIDGNSTYRISKLFKQLTIETSVNVRNAIEADLQITFKWASNPLVRHYSFQKHQISIDEHSKWLSSKLNNRNCYFFIVEYNKISIGSIRFDIDNNEAIISFLLEPKYHGQRLGVIILKKGIEKFIYSKIDEHEVTSIVGYVVPENIPSIRAFQCLGFTKSQIDDKIKFAKWI